MIVVMTESSSYCPHNVPIYNQMASVTVMIKINCLALYGSCLISSWEKSRIRLPGSVTYSENLPSILIKVVEIVYQVLNTKH